MNLINRFLWHYWWGQSQYLQQRLDELEAEENNLIEDRRKVRARLMKAEARVITYAQIGDEMKDLYRGDGGRLSSYDEGWNDGLEAAMKALSSERDAAVEAMKAAIAALVKSCRSAPTLTVKENYRVVKLLDAAIKAAQPSGYIIEEVSSGGYSVGGAGGSGPSAISDERILEILKSVDPKAVRLPTGWREFAHALIAAAQPSAISDETVRVPREPTDAILEAIWGRPLTANDTGARKIARAKYSDMLAAAQEGK